MQTECLTQYLSHMCLISGTEVMKTVLVDMVVTKSVLCNGYTMQPKKIGSRTQIDTDSPVFIAALFTTAKRCKQTKCPPTDK